MRKPPKKMKTNPMTDEEGEAEPDEEEVEAQKRPLPLPQGGESDGAEQEDDAAQQDRVGPTAMEFFHSW